MSDAARLLSLIDLTTHTHLVGQQIDLGFVDPPGVGLPFDADVTPDGQELWVVNAASNDVSVIDLVSDQLVAHIEVGDNPRGIVLSPEGGTAYVNNTLSGTVSVRPQRPQRPSCQNSTSPPAPRRWRPPRTRSQVQRSARTGSLSSPILLAAVSRNGPSANRQPR